MKKIEYSKDFEHWEIAAIWTEKEAKEKWPQLQKWIHQNQPFGFFKISKATFLEWLKLFWRK